MTGPDAVAIVHRNDRVTDDEASAMLRESPQATPTPTAVAPVTGATEPERRWATTSSRSACRS